MTKLVTGVEDRIEDPVTAIAYVRSDDAKFHVVERIVAKFAIAGE